MIWLYGCEWGWLGGCFFSFCYFFSLRGETNNFKRLRKGGKGGRSDCFAFCEGLGVGGEKRAQKGRGKVWEGVLGKEKRGRNMGNGRNKTEWQENSPSGTLGSDLRLLLAKADHSIGKRAGRLRSTEMGYLDNGWTTASLNSLSAHSSKVDNGHGHPLSNWCVLKTFSFFD